MTDWQFSLRVSTSARELRASPEMMATCGAVYSILLQLVAGEAAHGVIGHRRDKRRRASEARDARCDIGGRSAEGGGEALRVLGLSPGRVGVKVHPGAAQDEEIVSMNEVKWHRHPGFRACF